jgi:O-antigen ligase
VTAIASRTPRVAITATASHESPATGGPLVWLTSLAMAVVIYGVAVASGRASLLIAGGLAMAIPLIFAVRLEAGVLLIILLRPMLDVFADRTLASVGGLKLNPASVLAVLVIAIGVPYMVERAAELRRAPSIVPYLGFAAIAAVGIPVAPSSGSAMTEWFRLMSILVIYALAYLAASSAAAVRRLLVVILLSAVAPVVVGLEQLARGGTRQIGDYHRLTGTFLHPDPYGIYLSLIAVTAAAVALAVRSRGGWMAALAFLAAAVALYGSYTRTGWVLVGLGLLVLGAVRHRWLLIAVPVAAVLALTQVHSTSARFSDISNPRVAAVTRRPGNSFNSRINLWRENLPYARQKPLTGEGLNFIVERTSNQAHVHSDYVRALVETGMFGFVAYVVLLLSAVGGSVWALARSRTSTSPTLRTAALAGVATSACYLVASGDSNLMTQVAVSGTAWAMFACAHAVGRICKDESGEAPSPWPPRRAGAGSPLPRP